MVGMFTFTPKIPYYGASLIDEVQGVGVALPPSPCVTPSSPFLFFLPLLVLNLVWWLGAFFSRLADEVRILLLDWQNGRAEEPPNLSYDECRTTSPRL